MQGVRLGLLLLLSSAELGKLAGFADWWSSQEETTTAEPGSPNAKCNMYPVCAAQPNKTIPTDGFCCPTSDGDRMDCCLAGMARKPNATKYNSSTAICVIDVTQAAQMLGRAGTSVNAAVKTCVLGHGDEDKTRVALCASPVGSIISSLSYAASFLSLAAVQCAESLHIKDFMTDTLGWSPDWVNSREESAQLQAACAGAVTAFTAGLSQIAESGPSISTSCEWSKYVSSMPIFNGGKAEDPDAAARRAQDRAKAREAAVNATFIGESKEEIKQQQEAECAFDITQSATFLASAGTQINSAVQDCSDYYLKEGGKQAKAMCAVDTSAIIRSFGFVASMISYSVTNCQLFKVDFDAACSGAIADLVTGVSGLAAAGSAFRDTCETITNATKAIFT